MTLKVGSIVWSDRGIRCKVAGVFKDVNTEQIKILLQCPDSEDLVTPEQIRIDALPHK